WGRGGVGAGWERAVGKGAIISRGWLSEGGLEGGLVWLSGVTDDGWCMGRAARLMVLPCPSPSRIFDRNAAPSASLTASLRHGPAGAGGRQEPATPAAAQPATAPPRRGPRATCEP